MSTTTAPTPTHCPECAPRLPLRNHWFWGKCIVPRDLTDEQFFFLDKLRLHHQRLHGAGIVCGLQIGPHPNKQCRDRLVTLSPGSAVDCCGHDILVLEEDVIDLTCVPDIAAQIAKPDGKPHRLRFCIRYRECPTEEVPVLYDECACDDTRCAPNRILETYGIEVELDPPRLVHPVLQPRFTRITTLNVAKTNAVALDESGKRLLVMADTALFDFDAATHTLNGSRTLPAAGRTLALSTKDERLDLVAGGGTANDPKLIVLDIAGPAPIATATEHDGTLTGSRDSAVALAETPAGALVAVIAAKGGARLLPGPVPDPSGTPQQSDAGVATNSLALSSDANTAWLAQPGSATIHVVALNTTGLNQTTRTLSGGTGPAAHGDALATIATTGPDRLAVLDRANPRLHLVDPASGAVEGSVTLDHPPADLVISPGGQWAYVVLDDGTNGWVQAVNLQLLRQNKPVQAGTPEKLGPKPGKPVLNSLGTTLYVPVTDGVAVLGIDDVDCGALLRDTECPGCLAPDCLTLATVENWQPGFTLEAADPTANPADDVTHKIARIDNWTDRITLPSTQALASAVECLIAHGGAGGPGPQGPPGKDGKDGTDGTDGKDGKDGKDAIDTTLTHICGINWHHVINWHAAEYTKLEELTTQLDGEPVSAVAIAFSNDTFPTDPGKVRAADLNDINFTLLMEHVEIDGEIVARLCWCQVPATDVIGVQFTQECDTSSKASKELPEADLCNGALYLFDESLLRRALSLERNLRRQARLDQVVRFKVLVQGDLIRDLKDRALDANHLPPWLVPGTSTVTGDGIAGGLFESWFFVSLEGV
jgi:hypothetical protein